MGYRKVLAVLILMVPHIITGCGTYVPQMQEVWEGVDVRGNMEFNIKEKIFCETVRALRSVRQNIRLGDQPSIPDSYGVQMQISLTVEEAGTFNPQVTANDVLSNAIVGQGVLAALLTHWEQCRSAFLVARSRVRRRAEHLHNISAATGRQLVMHKSIAQVSFGRVAILRSSRSFALTRRFGVFLRNCRS